MNIVIPIEPENQKEQPADNCKPQYGEGRC